MRQTLARWSTGLRNRAQYNWWLIREGPRVGYPRPLLGPALTVALIVIVAVDITLVLRARRNEPATTIPSGDGYFIGRGARVTVTLLAGDRAIAAP